jgi:hypothetical protein
MMRSVDRGKPVPISSGLSLCPQVLQELSVHSRQPHQRERMAGLVHNRRTLARKGRSGLLSADFSGKGVHVVGTAVFTVSA